MLSISRTELARRTRQILERARRESAVVVESYGEEQVVIVDATDYRLLRALAAFRSGDGGNVPEALTAESLAKIMEKREGDKQAAWDLILAAYMSGNISLGRAAELLGLSRFDLQYRLHRLGIPLPLGAADEQEARNELQTLRS